jgi:hypothetical protein
MTQQAFAPPRATYLRGEIIDEPLVSRIRRLLWMYFGIRIVILGEANDAFGSNAA